MSVFIPAHVRGILYSVFALIGLGLGATQVGFASANSGQPTWLTVALAAFAFIGTSVGYTAASNTPAAPSATPALPDPSELYAPGAVGDGVGSNGE
jgi:hypothetical protein